MILSGTLYDAEELPCTVVGIPFVKAYGKYLSFNEFDVPVYTSEPLPEVPWLIQFLEEDKRKALGEYFLSLSYDLNGELNELPANYLTLAVANIVYNHQGVNTKLLPPRLGDVFSTSPYACSPLWLAYHLLKLEQSIILRDEHPDAQFRVYTLSRLIMALRRVIGQIIRQNPEPKAGTQVIVEATRSIGEKTVLFCDTHLLDAYLAMGGTVKELGTNWVTRKENF